MTMKGPGHVDGPRPCNQGHPAHREGLHFSEPQCPYLKQGACHRIATLMLSSRIKRETDSATARGRRHRQPRREGSWAWNLQKRSLQKLVDCILVQRPRFLSSARPSLLLGNPLSVSVNSSQD